MQRDVKIQAASDTNIGAPNDFVACLPPHRPPCRRASRPAARAYHAGGPMDHAHAARRRKARRGALRGVERRRRARGGLGLSVQRPVPDLSDFAADIELKARSVDPHFFAVVDNASGRAVGYQALMRIDPANRVIEVGNIMYTPAMQRTAGATEAQFCSRAMSSTCSATGATNGSATTSTRLEARGRALRLHIRGDFPPAHDRQGPQPRHRLVLDAGQRVAGPEERLRAMARAGRFRRRRPPERAPFRPHAEETP